jgi:kanamycin nucleotidyltransferase
MTVQNQRLELAKAICSQMLHTYEEQVIIGGVYGSTATDSNTPWSDLEMWFVVRDDCEAKGKHFLFRDIPVGYRVYKRNELEHIITHPSVRWPFHMGVLSVLKLLFGDPDILSSWLEMGWSVPKSTFYIALEEMLPGLVFESYGRIHSSAIRREEHTLLPAILEVLFEMLTALCLLNQSWITHDYYAGLAESFEFPKTPRDYEHIVPALYAARSFKIAVSLADELVSNFKDLLAEEGIRIFIYHSVQEIPM